MSTNNTVARSKFINAKPVYYPPIDNRWSNDDYGNTVYKTSVFNDKDGTITGVRNSYIVKTWRHRRSTRNARSSPPGTPRCARAISGA